MKAIRKFIRNVFRNGGLDGSHLSTHSLINSQYRQTLGL
jgi:hypothetical protein